MLRQKTTVSKTTKSPLQEKYPVYDYSLHEVTEIFHKAGFEVCLKRLPMEYFAIYHPNIVKEFGSLSHLVTHCVDHKMLFCFYKNEIKNVTNL